MPPAAGVFAFTVFKHLRMPLAGETAIIVGLFLKTKNVITENSMTALERRTVGSLALLYSFRMLGLFMVLPLLALYAVDLPGATPATIGLALGIYGLAQALLQVPLGWLSDQVGRKPVIIGGLLVFALGSVVAANATSIYGIVFGRTLQGAGAIASTLMALAADLTRDEQRTKAMAIMGMSIGLSFAVALVLGPVVALAGGLSAVFWLTAALAALGIAIVIFLVPTPPVGLLHAEVGAKRGLILQILREPVLLRLSFGVFTLHFVLMASFLVLPGLLEGMADLARERHWQVYLPALALSIVGMVPMMMLAERGGRLREMFLLAVALLGASLLLIGSASAPWGLYAGLLVFFIGFNYLEATLPSLVSKSIGAKSRGTAMGVFSTSQFLGAFAGGAVGGWLLGRWGVPALLGVSLGLLGVWWLLLLAKFAAPATAPTSR